MDIFVTGWIAFGDVWGRTAPFRPEEPSRDADPLANTTSDAVRALCKNMAPDVLRDTGLFIGTTLGSLEQDRRFDESRRQADGRYASPAVFARTLPSTIASELTIRFGMTGPTLVVSAGGASTILAVARAHSWMRHMGLKHCLAGGLEWLGPGIADETESCTGDRCRGVLCVLAADHSPGAMKIADSGIFPSTRRCTTHLDASMQQLTGVLQNRVAGEITADSGEGMSVSLKFDDR